MTATPATIRLVIADPLHARLAAEAIRAFPIAALENDAQPSTEVKIIDCIPCGAGGKRRLGAFLMAVRTAGAAPSPAVAFGPYRLDATQAMLIRDDGSTVSLTEKERDILIRLHREGGIVDRRTLLDEVWGYADTVETHTLETHIYRLRRKIEADPGAPRWLVTDEPGYRLIIG